MFINIRVEKRCDYLGIFISGIFFVIILIGRLNRETFYDKLFCFSYPENLVTATGLVFLSR